LDLKINRLQIIGGDVTYVDQGPFKPLHVSRVNLNARTSQYRIAGTGVSLAIHLGGGVDAGSVWLDGRADFLAEPHVGVRPRSAGPGRLDYFKPITNRYNLPSVTAACPSPGNRVRADDHRLILERVLVHGSPWSTCTCPYGRGGEGPGAADRGSGEAGHETSTEFRIARLEV